LVASLGGDEKGIGDEARLATADPFLESLAVTPSVVYQALRQLGVSFPLLLTARSGRGAWRMAKHPGLHTGLSNQTLRRYGFLDFADLRG
jgi:hypothetical protein